MDMDVGVGTRWIGIERWVGGWTGGGTRASGRWN